MTDRCDSCATDARYPPSPTSNGVTSLAWAEMSRGNHLTPSTCILPAPSTTPPPRPSAPAPDDDNDDDDGDGDEEEEEEEEEEDGVEEEDESCRIKLPTCLMAGPITVNINGSGCSSLETPAKSHPRATLRSESSRLGNPVKCTIKCHQY